MPSGRTHDRVTLWSLPWITLGTVWITRRGDLGLIVASGFLFSGLMLSPDLDLKSRPFQRWGWLRIIWIPYQKVLSHRSTLSHGFVIGTTVRLLYLVTILFFVAIFGVAIAQLILGFDWNWQTAIAQGFRWIKEHYPSAIALFLGLELGAASHYLADWIGSTHKRYQRQGWKGILPKRKQKRRRSRKSPPRRK
jgi:uncharacterized metal-binding protein